jgi:hypothetical protein
VVPLLVAQHCSVLGEQGGCWWQHAASDTATMTLLSCYVLPVPTHAPVHFDQQADSVAFLKDGQYKINRHTHCCRFCWCWCRRQVETWFNRLLDRSAALRDSLGQGGDAVSLQSSLDGLWGRREARVRRNEQQQQQQPVGVQQQPSMNGHHSHGYALTQERQPLQQQQQEADVQQQQQQPDLQQQEGYREQQQQQQQQRLADSLGPQQARHLLMQWHLANIEFANATRLRRLSMRVSQVWKLSSAYAASLVTLACLVRAHSTGFWGKLFMTSTSTACCFSIGHHHALGAISSTGILVMSLGPCTTFEN